MRYARAVDDSLQALRRLPGARHDGRTLLLSAFQAEMAERWHLAARAYLICLERATASEDEASVRFLAARLSRAYHAMDMVPKAEYYRLLTD